MKFRRIIKEHEELLMATLEFELPYTNHHGEVKFIKGWVAVEPGSKYKGELIDVFGWYHEKKAFNGCITVRDFSETEMKLRHVYYSFNKDQERKTKVHGKILKQIEKNLEGKATSLPNSGSEKGKELNNGDNNSN